MRFHQCLIFALATAFVSYSIRSTFSDVGKLHSIIDATFFSFREVPISQNSSHAVLGAYQSLTTTNAISIDPSFFERALDLGGKVRKYALDTFEEATHQFEDAEENIRDIRSGLEDLVSATGELRANVDQYLVKREGDQQLSGRLDKRGIDWDQFSADLSRVLNDLLENIKRQFPPPEEAMNHEQRDKMVGDVFSQARDSFLRLAVQHGMSEDKAAEFFDRIEPVVHKVVVILGDLAEQHPVLFETILITGVMLIIPESWILRPILGLFGFGPYGPIKGSSAAWAQSRFFGMAVRSGSWFARLQSLGMKLPSSTPVKKIIGWLGAVIGGVGIALGQCR